LDDGCDDGDQGMGSGKRRKRGMGSEKPREMSGMHRAQPQSIAADERRCFFGEVGA